MEYRDYYRVLGVDKDASSEEIRKRYRQLARKHHPDVNPNDKGAEERFKEINEAYEVLRDSEKRSKYDQLGANWHQYQQAGGDPGGFPWGQWSSGAGPAGGGGRVYTTENIDLNDLFGNAGFSDFFQNIFGGGGAGASHTQNVRRGRYSLRGRDIEQPVDITLEEAYHGATRVFQVGSRRLEIKIPPGVTTGSRVRVAGEGEPGQNDGQPGDLYLIIAVKEHQTYRRENNDLNVKLPVDLYTLVLGGEVLVQTLKGRISLKIPPETKTGQTFRLRGQGMPLLRSPSECGDLRIEVEPMIPSELSSEERDLFRQLAELRKHRATKEQAESARKA